MSDPTYSFDDGAAYERFMGSWSRAAGAVFLDWLKPPTNACWLDVGCGTGAFTRLIVNRCAPLAVQAVDPVAAQVEYARFSSSPAAGFEVADAVSLPFAEATFGVVVSALVLNFIPDMPRALAEMYRVTRPGGVIAGYVWDFAAELSPSGPFREGLIRFGLDVPNIPGTRSSSLDALAVMFHSCGLSEIATVSFEVSGTFDDFEHFWQSQTPSYSPTTRIIDALSPADLSRLRSSIRASLPEGRDGKIHYQARANAIKSRRGMP